MMKFRSEFDIKKLQKNILHTHKLMLVGSCFTENIGEKLRKHKFKTLENPNGILFNPISVAEAFRSYIRNEQINNSHIFQHNETWHSWKHHSRFSGLTADECIHKINSSTSQAHLYLKHADHLVITLGSSWLYLLTEVAAIGPEGSVAANNHKAPSNWFTKRLLGSDEAAELLDTLIKDLLSFNPSLQIILTISPVRHLREGVIENNRSKAVLIQAVHQMAERYESVYYFPSYELVIDDLRDYRFYAEDLVHPNYQATNYVWEKFTNACMNEETRQLMKEIAEINLAVQHKPFNATTTQHQHFLSSYLSKTKLLQDQYPFIDLKNEIDFFKDSIG